MLHWREHRTTLSHRRACDTGDACMIHPFRRDA